MQLGLLHGFYLININVTIITTIVTMPVQTNVFHMNDININFNPKSVTKKEKETGKTEQEVNKQIAII